MTAGSTNGDAESTDAEGADIERTDERNRRESARPHSVGEHDIHWPVPESVTLPLAAALSGLMVWAFGFDWVLISLVPLMVVLAVITVIDLRALLIPDLLTRPATALIIPLLAVSLLSDWSDIDLVRALLGAAVMGGLYFLLWLVFPAGMGKGDVKLAPILGAQLGFFGWIPLGQAILAAHVLGGVAAIVLLIAARAKRGTGFPFGPFMIAGTVIALVLEARGI